MSKCTSELSNGPQNAESSAGSAKVEDYQLAVVPSVLIQRPPRAGGRTMAALLCLPD